ncbi:MAG: TonB-dependent receptor, partial [Bacteroidota bacterium]
SSSLNPVMDWNTLPGINLEQRAISSYRVSIRGSSLRSPFGVRNVKVYWNGFIFTEANGSTALNLFGNDQMQELEVIRGPSGSMYGAGIGGVIRLSNFQDRSDEKISLNLTSGSFGLLNGSLGYRTGKGKWSSYTNLSYQKLDGYRDHNAQDRLVAQWSNRYEFNEKHQVELHTLYSDLVYEIPGGLTLEQFNSDPTMARPGSAEQNASIDQRTFLLGARYESEFTSQLSQNTHVLLTSTDFENPFILDYKEDLNKELAIRQQWSYRLPFLLSMNWSAGWEWQLADNQAKNFGNINGVRDTIRFSDELKIDRKVFFLQLQWRKNKWSFTAGLSSNSLKYEVDRVVNAFAEPFDFERRFDNELIPRLAISRGWNDENTTYVSVGEGFSSPTLDEIRTNEGSINTDLQAERGTNYEIGHKFYSDRHQLDVALFYMELDDAITTRTDPNGVVLFQNAGGTSQRGLEIGLKSLWHVKNRGFVSQIKSSTAYQYYDFTFEEYSKRGEDFSDNDVTGVPNHSLFQTVSIELKKRFTTTLQHRLVSQVPLTDNNEVLADTYHLLNLKSQYQFHWNKVDAKLYGGVENLGGIDYSLGNDLNAFGGRFYQPAPARNLYVGVQLKF